MVRLGRKRFQRTSCISCWTSFKGELGYEPGKLPMLHWLEKWSVPFHTKNMDVLYVNCGKPALTVEKSLARHSHAGLGIFATKPFGQGTKVVYYYISLVSPDLTRRKHRELQNGQHIRDVTRGHFQKRADRLHENVVDEDSVECGEGILLAPFCAMQYINRQWYLPGTRRQTSTGCDGCIIVAWIGIRHDRRMDHQILSLIIFSWCKKYSTMMFGRSFVVIIVFHIPLVPKVLQKSELRLFLIVAGGSTV